MTDKLRKTIPINITFGTGEQPTSTKLNAVTTQARSGTDIIERAIGDLWNQSGDQLLNTTPLQQPNLARLLGENKYLNPAIYPLENTFLFRDDLATKYLGQTEGFLTFKPGATPSYAARGTINGQFVSLVASEHLVLAVGDYWVDPATGRFRLNDPLLGGEVLEYQVDPQDDWLTGTESLPGVIPDPRQTEFTGVRISGASPYYMHLPPRRPIAGFAAAGTGYNSEASRPDKYPISTEIGIDPVGNPLLTNEAAELVGGGGGTGGDTGLLYWQHDSVDALGDEHYRYALPKEILDGTFAAGEIYPSGYMYLWNTITNSIIEDAVFRKPSNGDPNKWVIEVSSVSFDFSTATTGTEAKVSYDDSGLILITCGAPVARSVWRAISTFYSHKHDGSGALDAHINHNNLLDLDPPQNLSVNEHFGRYPTYLGPWEASAWNNDGHNSLLSRAGAQTDSARERDQYNNAMLGHLLIANADTSGSENYLDDTLPDDSFKIYFGDVTGPALFSRGGEDLVYSSPNAFAGLLVSSTLSGATSRIEVGSGTGGSSGNRGSYLDLIGDDTYTDYGLRIIRNNLGPNTTSQIKHRGTGELQIDAEDGGGLDIDVGSYELKISAVTKELVTGTDTRFYNPITQENTADTRMSFNGSLSDWSTGVTGFTYVINNNLSSLASSPGDDVFSVSNAGTGPRIGIGTGGPAYGIHLRSTETPIVRVFSESSSDKGALSFGATISPNWNIGAAWDVTGDPFRIARNLTAGDLNTDPALSIEYTGPSTPIYEHTLKGDLIMDTASTDGGMILKGSHNFYTSPCGFSQSLGGNWDAIASVINGNLRILASGTSYYVPIRMPRAGTITAVSFRARTLASSTTFSWSLMKKAAVSDPTAAAVVVGGGIFESDTITTTPTTETDGTFSSEAIDPDTLYYIALGANTTTQDVYINAIWVTITDPDVSIFSF